MATPPLPDVPCVRVRMTYNEGAPGEGGNRFYISYSGSSPTAANCTTFANGVEAAWSTHLAPVINTDMSLYEVDVIDIASDTGASGQWTGTAAGTRSGTVLPVQCATNVEFDIANRYRGGKPRMFLPPGVDGDLNTISQWGAAFIAGVNTAVLGFFEEIEGLIVGSMGTLQHVVLSYYSGYETSSPPWRGPGYKYPPKYRPLALHRNVEGYSCKAVVGSQKRRRTSTTP